MATAATTRDSRPSAYPTDRQASSLFAVVSRWCPQQADLPGYRLIWGCGHRHSQTLAATPDGLTEGTSTPRKAAKGNSRISKTAQEGHKGRATGLRLYLHCLEHRPTEHSHAEDHRHQNMQRLAATTGACGGFCLSSAQAHPQGQTKRAGLSQGSEEAQAAQKGALAPNADYELWYLDESEFHLHPHLTRMWMPKGKQRRVRSPGVNRKQTVFGAFCYGRGLFYYHVQPRKTAWGVQMLLQKLLRRARRTGRPILVVMDQGNPHHAKALERYLQDVKEHIQVFWLPHYSPELNLIEPLWKHIKGSRMADVLFPSFRQFSRHLLTALAHFALHPDFTLSVVTAKCHKTIRKNLLVAT